MRASSAAARPFASFSQPIFCILLALLIVMSASVSLAQIGVSPATEKFSSQLLTTTSAAKSVTLTNNGASAQAFVITMSGDFTQSNTCGGTIAGSGGVCTVKVMFTPTLSGSIKGAMSVYDNSNNLLAFVGLSGTGEAPVTTSPSSLSFTGGTVGTISTAKTVKITNNTTTSVTITSITTNVPDYTISTGTCLTTPLATKGSNCLVTVQVTPSSAADDGAIIITDNLAIDSAGPVVVKLTSSATGGATPPISLSKTTLAFKTFNGTTSAAQTITVTNTSGGSVTIGTITATTDYSILNNTCTSALAAGAKCTFQIEFGPNFVGSIEGSVAVPFTPSSNASPQIVNLNGTSEAALTNSPASITFKPQGVGTTSAASKVTVTNNSGSAITLSNIAVSADFGIQLAGTTCSLTGGSLNPGKNCVLEIQISPTITGAIEGAITITNTGSPNPLIIGLAGTGTNTASAALNPGSAHQGTAETILVTGTNTNFGPTTTVSFGADITVGTITVNGPTSLSVPITIDNVATVGSRNATFTTGAQVVNGSFTVVAGVPVVTVINPNTIQSTQTESVAITGAFTNWVSGTTKANFGTGVSVGGATAGTFGPVTVNSATSLTANLKTSGAANGFRTVQIQTGAQTLTVNNGLDVETCNGTAPTILQVSPGDGVSNVALNTVYQAQFSVPMSRSTFSLGNSGSTTIFFRDSTTGVEVPGTVTLDASATIATITPSVALYAGRTYYVYFSYSQYIQDACGTNFGGAQYSFTTAFSENTTGPSLTSTSPENSDTNIALSGNAGTGIPVVLQFSNPVDPVTAQLGFSMTAGGNAVPGNFSYSPNDTQVTFTPVNPLTASTTYTVNYTNQITDYVGNGLTNPGSFTFTTGTVNDTTTPTVTFVDPPSNQTNVGLNVAPRIAFNEPVNEVTIPGALALYYEGNLIVPATVTVAPNRMSATITPSAALLPETQYEVYICGYSNIVGNNGSCFGSFFETGTTNDTTHATVTAISPAASQVGVPLNAVVSAVMSSPVDPTTINNNSITVTPSGGSAIAGTVSLAGDDVTLTFTPTAALTASKVYNVSVGGFNDIGGNSVTTFNSSFTTGSTSYGNGSFQVTTVSPVNGAVGVSVTSPVTFTMTNLIDPASVSGNTVFAYVSGSNVIPGNYSISGNQVTFTPLASSPYPPSTTMNTCVYALMDLAGNTDYQCYTFTTANTADSTHPTVTISPTNGAVNQGLNTQIVLTFSKAINPASITTNSLALFNGDTAIGYSYSISRDSRTIILNPGGSAWASGATITIELTTGIQDLSGNSLANTTSQFTLTTALPTSAPFVVAMRPGSGANNVPANSPVTLFVSAPLNTSTIPGALNVTDNGIVISGTTQITGNGQAILFTPAAAFGAGDTIQVFLGSGALSSDGVPVSGFSGQFTVAGSLATTAAQVQLLNPPSGSVGAPLNTTIQVEFNQPIQGSTVTCTGSTGSVTLYQYATSSYLSPTCSVSGGVISIAPTSNLVAGSQYQVYISYASAVTNTSGVPVTAYAYNFTAGTAADNTAPTITAEAPINNATNIGTNSAVSLTLNKPMNPISVTGSTILLTGGGVTEIPSSMSFSPDYTHVSIIPQAPLPASTVMTLKVSGVTSEAGKSVATTTTSFTTQAQPDFTAPYVVSSSVLSGQAGVPVNSVFSMTFSKAMDEGTFNAVDVNVYGGPFPNGVPATVSWSADQTTVFIVPTSALYVGTAYNLESYYMTDLEGNPEANFNIGFTTSFASNTVAPTVVNTSPENSETAVPNNAPVEILFSEPIQPTSIGAVTVTTGGNAVSVTPTWSDGNQLLKLTPNSPLLQANATYTITITGVKDTAGNTMSGTTTNTFTTGSTFDLTQPTILLTDPANNTTGAGTNVTPRVVFSKRMNPLTIVTSSNEGYINDGSVELADTATNQWVPVTVSMDATRTIATITPNSALNPNTQYELYIGCSQAFFDVAGNYGGCGGYYFTTASGADTMSATVTAISPTNSETAVPLNALVTALMSDAIDPTTVTNSSITVTPSGGSAIAGTTALQADGVTLIFTPSAPLTASKVHNVSVSGFKDVEGNTITTFNSSFTTGSTSYANGSFQVTTVSPVNGAVGVSVTSPVTFTMTNLIDPASVSGNTVFAYVSGSYVMTGTYSVSGNQVTFTPSASSPYPANTTMNTCVYGLMDLAGNTDYQCYTFTTANTADSTKPTVTITPSNGSSLLGLNTQAVLTFSKSINPATITSASVNMFNGDTPLNPGYTISRDSKTVTLNPGTLPAGATITVSASHLITDYSGNPLSADTTSQFTTTTAVLNTAPYVVSMRPGNGAVGVPTNSTISLFTSAPMNVGSLTGALHVTQNGVVISGSTTVGANGQNIAFTPSSALAANTVTQVFLDSTAQDIYGNYLSYFAQSFTTAVAESGSSQATVVTLNPFPSATNVPTNTVIQVEYNEPILGSSVTCNLGSGSSVTLYQYSTSSYLNPTCSVSGGVITIAPSSNLVAGSQYQVYISYATNVTNTDGSPVQAYAYNFTAGSGTDTAAPTILYVAPPNSATNIGTNAGVSVTFNKPINPVSVTGSTVKLSGGGITEVPTSIGFSTDYKRLTITPQAPLPSSTVMTIAISGVTSEAGVSVAAQSPTFTTMAGPDFGTPSVINTSVQNSQTVGTNASFAMQFNKPMDPGSVNPGGAEDVFLQDETTTTYVNTNITFSADLTTVFLKPTANLTGSHQFQLCSYYMTDLNGNAQNNFCVTFNSAASTITTGPSVLQVSPPNTLTGIALNSPIAVLFNDYIDAASIGGVTLKHSSTVIPANVTVYDGDQGVQLTPLAPLSPSTTYTINVTGVLDITGNAQSSFSPTSFTTGTGTDLVQPSWTTATCSGNPCSGAVNVPDNTTVVVTFSKAMDPASFDPANSFTLRTTSNTVVPATITFNSTYTQATLQPNSVLAAASTYYMEISYQAPLFDLAGNQLNNGTYFSFTTH